MRTLHSACIVFTLLAAGAAYAQQKSNPPHMTSSGPTMPVPQANATPGVVDPAQANNNTANDRSNSAATTMSQYQKDGPASDKAKKHKATATRETPNAKDAGEEEKSRYRMSGD